MNDFENRSVSRRTPRKRKKGVLKNWIILFETITIIALIIALIAVSMRSDSKPGSSSSNSSDNIVSNESVDSNLSSSESLADELSKWYMVLANPDNSLSNDFIRNVELAEIESKFSSGQESSKYFDKRAVEYLNNICAAALEDGIHLQVVSAYRTYAKQDSLYKNRVQRCINEGYNQEEAKKVAATIVALPGTSEHHTGLAVDFNSVETSFENTKAFRWLQENAADYGFVMRYPENKQDITKIIYEPWHYRYVGVEHAKRMNELNMCMEEYVEYLSKN